MVNKVFSKDPGHISSVLWEWGDLSGLEYTNLLAIAANGHLGLGWVGDVDVNALLIAHICDPLGVHTWFPSPPQITCEAGGLYQLPSFTDEKT